MDNNNPNKSDSAEQRATIQPYTPEPTAQAFQQQPPSEANQAPGSPPQSSPQAPAPQPAQAPQQQYAPPSIPPQQPSVVVNNQVMGAPSVVVAVAPKSVALAVVLTIFFGPLGMFYSTVTGAIIMLIVSIIAAAFTLGFSLFVTWPICVVWGAIAASSYNQQLMAPQARQVINN
jgi:hypothetical protein